MVDQESRSYRPRRAFIEPEAEPTPPPAPDPAPAPGHGQPPAPPRTSTTRTPRSRCTATSTCRGRSTAPNARPTGARQPRRRWSTAGRPQSTARRRRSTGSLQPPAAPPRPDANDVGSDDTAIRSFTFAPRTRRTARRDDHDPARSGSTARGRCARPAPRSRRPRRGRGRRRTAGRSASGPAGPWPSASSPRSWCSAWRSGTPCSASATTTGHRPAARGDRRLGGPGADDQRLRAADHQRRSAADQRPDAQCRPGQAARPEAHLEGVADPAGRLGGRAGAGLFRRRAAERAAGSQQKILRVLSSSGKSAPSALHEATAYATPEEAAQAFAVASRTLGTCPAAGAWIASGRVVRGVGEQAAGDRGGEERRRHRVAQRGDQPDRPGTEHPRCQQPRRCGLPRQRGHGADRRHREAVRTRRRQVRRRGAGQGRTAATGRGPARLPGGR